MIAGFDATLAWSRICNEMISNPSAHRLDSGETDTVHPKPSPLPRSASRVVSDYARVEDLLDRCWDELGGIELNVKLTDLIRLLEFKHKLAASAEAERDFWDLIDTIRRDELAGFGDVVDSENDT